MKDKTGIKGISGCHCFVINCMHWAIFLFQCTETIFVLIRITQGPYDPEIIHSEHSIQDEEIKVHCTIFFSLQEAAVLINHPVWPWNTKIWFINGVDNINWPPYRDWKADVLSVSPSDLLWWRANARNVSFSISVRWSIYIINSVDKPNFRVSLPHRHSTTVCLETNPLYSFMAME